MSINEKKPKGTETPSEDKPTPHGGDKPHGGGEEKKSPSIIKWVLTIIFGILVFGFLYWLIFVPSSKENNSNKSSSNIIREFSKEGEAIVTLTNPAEAWISPFRSYIRFYGNGGIKLISKSSGNFLILKEKPENIEQQQKWAKISQGDYYIYPFETDTMKVSWWLAN